MGQEKRESGSDQLINLNVDGPLGQYSLIVEEGGLGLWSNDESRVLWSITP